MPVLIFCNFLRVSIPTFLIGDLEIIFYFIFPSMSTNCGKNNPLDRSVKTVDELNIELFGIDKKSLRRNIKNVKCDYLTFLKKTFWVPLLRSFLQKKF